MKSWSWKWGVGRCRDLEVGVGVEDPEQLVWDGKKSIAWIGMGKKWRIGNFADGDFGKCRLLHIMMGKDLWIWALEEELLMLSHVDGYLCWAAFVGW